MRKDALLQQAMPYWDPRSRHGIAASDPPEVCYSQPPARRQARRPTRHRRAALPRPAYATWLVDDEVPPNMVQRVMGHEHVTTTLQLYVRRTEHHHRIREALDTHHDKPDQQDINDDDDGGTAGVLVPIG